MDVHSNISDGINVCSDISIPNMIHGSLFSAICIILTLAFLGKRKKSCLDCCGGKPGVVVPLNMLDDFENRWSYACSFGALINIIPTLWVAGDNAFKNVDTTYSKVFLSLIYTAEVCIAYYPFFACLLTEFKFIGAIIGGLYSLAWFVLMSTVTIQCSIDFKASATLLNQIPAIVCLIVTTVRFISIAIEQGKKREYLSTTESSSNVMAPYQIEYVKYLLTKPDEKLNQQQNNDETTLSKWKKKITKFISTYIYEQQPNFNFSARIICAMFIAVLITYQITLGLFFVNAQLGELLNDVAEIILNRTEISPDDIHTYKIIDVLLEAGIYILLILSLVLLTLDVAVILTKYRTNLLQLHRGDYSFIPPGYSASSSKTMRYAMVFPGYQIAYKIWAMLLLVLAGWTFWVIFVSLIAITVTVDAVDLFGTAAALIIIPAVVSLALQYLQQAMCYYLFLQNKISEEDSDKPLAVRNRDGYHIANYFFLMTNIPIGLFSCLLRIGRSFIWGLVFLGRVDRCVLPPGFEYQDYGYMSYLGMLLVENSHNHPILRVFCQHLIWSLKFRKITNNTGSGSINHVYSSTQDMLESVNELNNFACQTSAGMNQLEHISRAKIRWHLFITLAKNPNLIPERKHNIQKSARVKQNNGIKAKIVSVIKNELLGIGGNSNIGTNAQSMTSYQVQAIVASQLQERDKLTSSPSSDTLKSKNELPQTGMTSKEYEQSTRNFKNKPFPSADVSLDFPETDISNEPVYANFNTTHQSNPVYGFVKY